MTLILTNDDGIDAPGILALSQAVQGKGVIVAPKEHHSGCGHQITAYNPIHVEKRSATVFAVGGTPANGFCRGLMRGEIWGLMPTFLEPLPPFEKRRCWALKRSPFPIGLSVP